MLHGAPIDVRALLARVVTDRTRYLILDLDRTLHLGRNMGELLGWEVGALHCYGARHLERAGATRAPGRFFLDAGRPLGACRYLARGAAAWAYPGLYYLLWGKLGPHAAQVVRHRYLRFGAEPHRIVQRVPSVALLHELAAIPLDTARALAGEVFRRHRRDQVIERADLDWLRRRHPKLVIILSSASPQPMVEAAAAEIGVDVIDHTTVEVHDGYLSSPHRLHPLFWAPRLPRRISPPSAFHINAGHTKVQRLVARFPDLLSPGVETVGVSDTSHGEDHPWASYLTRVVDINSTAPFPPLVSSGAPLTEVHSAQVLTRAEREARETGAARLDPRRRRLGPADAGTMRTLSRAELAERLGDLTAEVEALAERHALEAERLAPVRVTLDATLAALSGEMEAIVSAYNLGAAGRRDLRGKLLRCLAAEAHATRAAHRRLRPLLELRCAIDGLLATSRRTLAARPDNPSLAPAAAAGAPPPRRGPQAAPV